MGLGTSRKQSDDCPVNRHGLIRLVLDSKGMSHSNPSIDKAFIEHNCFLEIFPSNLKLFTVKIISSDHEPTYRVACIVLNKIMSRVIKLSS